MTPIFRQWRQVPSWRGFLYLAALLVCLVLLGLRLRTALPANAWSVAYARLAMNGRPGLGVLPDPPPSHKGGLIWMAGDALAMGDAGRALEIISLAPSGRSIERMRITALALEGQRRFPEAIQVWIRTHDIHLLHAASERARQDARPFDAVALMNAAYEIDPSGETLNLADTLWNTAENREAAIELLRASITAHPDSPVRVRWMLRLGDFLRFEQKGAEAASVYRQVIGEDPESATAWIGLGWAVYGTDPKASESRRDFEMAIELAPEGGDGYLAMGQLLAREGLHAEADIWFEKAIASRPNNPWWLLVRANNAREGNDLNHAFELYEDVTSRFPEFAAGYYEEALAHERAGNRTAAIDAIERAIELQMPPSVDYYLRAGQIYGWAGDDSRALQAYRQALLIDPQNAVARQGADKLEQSTEPIQ